ncbi:MAG: zinc ribbon domain-containing protein [Crocinitomicaceae bacterium]|nr:zinc ribbon domain-containing protein [Crocinitomicaceae bacterium]
MYQEDLEKLIKYALVDGNVSPKDREILVRKAVESGIDKDEFEMVLDARIYEFNENRQATEEEKAEEPAAQPTSKTSNKCPNCQANIDASSTTCEYCGHDVVNRQSNASIQRLFNLLNEAEEERKKDPDGMFSSIGKAFSEAFSDMTGPGKVDRKKMEIISSFPIPTTKHDILEFLALAYPKAKLAGNIFTRNSDKNKLHNQFAMVWKGKCEQIILKAKFSMKDDMETLNEVLYYGKELGID